MTSLDPQSVAILNRMLQGELSAIATYDLALTHLRGEPVTELGQNRDCHAARAEALSGRIRALGGEPATSSGLWVGFTKLVEQGAALLGSDAVIAVLEQGEDIGLKQYREHLADLDPESHALVETDLRPAQDRSHARLLDLQLARK